MAAHEAAAAGLWWRLKICRYDECEWAYYDHSKNRSRNYCEYNCGNKLKTRAYRARQKAAGPASPEHRLRGSPGATLGARRTPGEGP